MEWFTPTTGAIAPVVGVDNATFEAYCRERWGMTHRHVNRQIIAGEVAAALGPIGPVPESQARELADLRGDPEQLRDTYRKAHEQTGGNVTAAAIREVRNLRTPEPESEAEAAKRVGGRRMAKLHPVKRLRPIGPQ